MQKILHSISYNMNCKPIDNLKKFRTIYIKLHCHNHNNNSITHGMLGSHPKPLIYVMGSRHSQESIKPILIFVSGSPAINDGTTVSCKWAIVLDRWYQ